MESAIDALNALLEEILLQDKSVDRLAMLMKVSRQPMGDVGAAFVKLNFFLVFQLLYPWFSSDIVAERERSIDTSLKLLKTYFNVMDYVPGVSHVAEMGLLNFGSA